MELLQRSFLLAFFLQTCLAFKGHQVFKIIPETHRQVAAIENIVKEIGNKVDVWNDRVFLNKPVNVQASPEIRTTLWRYIQHHGLAAKVVIPDLSEAIHQQVDDRTPFDGDLSNFTFHEYHPLEEIEEWMEAIVEANSDVAELVVIGYSYELRPIYAIRASLDLSATERLPVIWMDAGIHSREWVAPATMIYFIDKFLADYKTDEVLSESLKTHDWYFMPVFNVDGYNYTWIQDEQGELPNRLWRRTRSQNPGYNETCWGSDPNRNWDRKWGTTSGISFDPCSLIYCGNSPWSEPSVRQVAFYLRDQIQLNVYFAYHSYTQLYMVPYGYTEEKSEDYDELMEVCQRGIEKVMAVYGTEYECGSLIDKVGPNSGSSVDYVYDVIGTKYSFAVELRDKGDYGFILPEDQIIPTANESWPFVLSVVEDFMASGVTKIVPSFTNLSLLVFIAISVIVSK